MTTRNYNLIFRIMHWAIAICMVLILITIFLRLTWMNKDNVADILENNLPASDTTFSRADLILLAKKIRKPMWEWHVYLGYILTGLFSIRLALPFFGQMKIVSPLNPQLTGKEKFQFWVYIVFYVCVTVSLVTGLFIEFGPKELEEIMEEIHVLSIYYLLTYMFLHIGGVLLAEFGKDQGIISRIVSGMKK